MNSLFPVISANIRYIDEISDRWNAKIVDREESRWTRICENHSPIITSLSEKTRPGSLLRNIFGKIIDSLCPVICANIRYIGMP